MLKSWRESRILQEENHCEKKKPWKETIEQIFVPVSKNCCICNKDVSCLFQAHSMVYEYIRQRNNWTLTAIL